MWPLPGCRPDRRSRRRAPHGPRRRRHRSSRSRDRGGRGARALPLGRDGPLAALCVRAAAGAPFARRAELRAADLDVVGRADLELGEGRLAGEALGADVWVSMSEEDGSGKEVRWRAGWVKGRRGR